MISAKNTCKKIDSEYRRYFSKSDFEKKYMDEITKEDIENICFANLQILMGLRRGEIPPLTWDDISDTHICISKEQLTSDNKTGIILGPHSFRRNAITDVVNATNGNIIMASSLFGNNTPYVAKQNYYTDANLAKAKEILDSRNLV